MSKNEKMAEAKRVAKAYVRQLRESNIKAAKKGAPKIAESEYRRLAQQLERKLVRT